MDQQQLLAEQLRRYQGQAQTQAPEGRMVGRVYVAPNPLEYLAAGLRGYGGMKGEQQTQQAMTDLQAKRQAAMQEALRGFGQTMQGTPAQPEINMDEGPGANTFFRPATEAKPGDPMAAYQQLLGSEVPELQKMGMQGMAAVPEMQARQRERAEDRTFRADQAAADRKAREDQLAEAARARAEQTQMAHQLRMDELAARNASAAERAAADREFRAEQLKAQQDFQREMKKIGGAIASSRNAPADPESQLGFNKQFGKPPAGFRWKQDGSMEPIPGGPADRKTNEQLAGKETVDSVVSQLRQSYDTLDKGGGITSTQQGALSNIGRTLSKSAVGQFAGGAVGSQNQKERDAIAQARPLLLQAIMKATGMSAKQMDSNAELKLYLATATDPTLSLEANKEALNRIAELYGSGGTPKQPAALSPEDAQARDWALKNPNDPRAKKILQRLGG